MLGSRTRFSFTGGVCVAVIISACVAISAPSGAQDLAWLGGDTVEVAAHRTGLLGSRINRPLLGYLAKPDTPGRHAAVVVLHGCSGFNSIYTGVADVLKSYGYVALAIDSLDGTNACHTDGEAAEAIDSYAALDWLARQDFVDPDRVAVLGFSMGGFASLDDVETGPPAIEKIEKRHFRAAVAYYPGCRWRAGVMTVPTLILIGSEDDWTRAAWCQDMMTRRDEKGAPVKLVVYPGATHAFDIPAPARLYLGHHLAYDPQATADAWRQVRYFLQAALGGPQPAGPEQPAGAAERG